MTPLSPRANQVLQDLRASRRRLTPERKAEVRAAVWVSLATSGTAAAEVMGASKSVFWSSTLGKVIAGLSAAVVGSGATYGVVSAQRAADAHRRVGARNSASTTVPTARAPAPPPPLQAVNVLPIEDISHGNPVFQPRPAAEDKRTQTGPIPVPSDRRVQAPKVVAQPGSPEPSLPVVTDVAPRPDAVVHAREESGVRFRDENRAATSEPPNPPQVQARASSDMSPRPAGAARRAPETEPLGDELASLRLAMTRHEAGDNSNALKALDEYQKRFSTGVLSSEASALRVLVLCELGRVAEATKTLEILTQTAPQSPVMERLKSSCAREVTD